MTNGGDSTICAGSRCQHKNTPHARYCARCGKTLSFCNQAQLAYYAGMQHNPAYLQEQAAGMRAVQPDPYSDSYEQRILLDDSREDTCGCSRAAWDWFRSWTLLGWIVAACLAVWLLAKLGWEVGRWWIA